MGLEGEKGRGGSTTRQQTHNQVVINGNKFVSFATKIKRGRLRGLSWLKGGILIAVSAIKEYFVGKKGNKGGKSV